MAIFFALPESSYVGYSLVVLSIHSYLGVRVFVFGGVVTRVFFFSRDAGVFERRRTLAPLSLQPGCGKEGQRAVFKAKLLSRVLRPVAHPPLSLSLSAC